VRPQNYTNRTYAEIAVGESVTVARRLGQTDLEALALVSGQVDPFHIEDGDAPPTGLVVRSVGAEALISGLLNRRLPGPGTTILSQELRFTGTVTVTAREKRDEGHVILFDCRVKLGNADVVTGTVVVAAPTTHITYSDVATPELILRHNDAFTKLLRRCQGIPAVTCAIVHPCDRDSLLGPLEAAKRGLIIPVLVGPEAKIRSVAEAEKADISAYRIIDTEHSHAAACGRWSSRARARSSR
jgi:hypothetical protein